MAKDDEVNLQAYRAQQIANLSRADLTRRIDSVDSSLIPHSVYSARPAGDTVAQFFSKVIPTKEFLATRDALSEFNKKAYNPGTAPLLEYLQDMGSALGDKKIEAFEEGENIGDSLSTRGRGLKYDARIKRSGSSPYTKPRTNMRSNSLNILRAMSEQDGQVTFEGIDYLTDGIEQLGQLGFSFLKSIKGTGLAGEVIKAGKLHDAEAATFTARKLLANEAVSQAIEDFSSLDSLQSITSGKGFPISLRRRLQKTLGSTEAKRVARYLHTAFLGADTAPKINQYISGFRAAANSTYDEYLDIARGMGDFRGKNLLLGGQSQRLREEFVNSAWSEFVRPLVENVRDTSQTPYSFLHGPRMVDASILEPGKLSSKVADFLGARDNQQVRDSIAQRLISFSGETTDMPLLDMGRAFEGKIPEIDSALKFNLLRNMDRTDKGYHILDSHTASIRMALAKLDMEEAKIAATMAEQGVTGLDWVGGKHIPKNRTATFDRLTYRVSQELRRLNTAFPDEKWQSSFDLIGGQTHIAAGGAVRVSMYPQAHAAAARGSEGFRGSQFEMSIQDRNGIFHTANGKQFHGYNVMISHDVLENSGVAIWNKRLGVVTNGFYQISSRNRTVNAAKLSIAQRKAIKGRIARNLERTPFASDIFSATESLGAHLDNAIRGSTDALIKEHDQMLANLRAQGAMRTFWNPKEGFIEAVTNMPSTQRILTRSKVFAPAYFMDSPLSPFNMERGEFASSVNQEILHNVLSGNYEQYLKGDSALSNKASRIFRFLSTQFVNIYEEDAVRANMSSVDYLMSLGRREFSSAMDVTGDRIRRAEFARAAGYLPIGPLAKSPKHFMTPQMLHQAWPGGRSAIRPIQEFSRFEDLPLPGSNAPAYVAHPFAQMGDNYGDPELKRLIDTNTVRYGHVGIIDGGEIDGRAVSAEEMSDEIGAREQNIVVNPEFQEAFGEGYNLRGSKLFAYNSKGMSEVGSSDTLNFGDSGIDMFWGIQGSKIVGKHQSGEAYYQGVLNRIMESPRNLEEANQTASILRKVFGPDNYAFEVSNNMVSMKHLRTTAYAGAIQEQLDAARQEEFKHYSSYGTYNMAQAVEALNQVNSYRDSVGADPIGIRRWVNITNRGKNLRVLTTDLILPVSKIKKGEVSVTNPTSFTIQHLENMRAMGLDVMANDMATQSMLTPKFQRQIFSLNEHITAIQNMEQGDVLGGLGSDSISDLYSERRLSSTGELLSHGEYHRLYPEAASSSTYSLPRPVGLKGHYEGQGTSRKWVNDVEANTISVPRQFPQSNDTDVFITPLQKQLNKVIASANELDGSKETVKTYEAAVKDYYSGLHAAVGGSKNALLKDTIFGRETQGPGFTRSNLFADPNNALQVGEASVSPDFLKTNLNMGLNDQGVYRDAESGRHFMYGIVHRDPEIYPRGSMKVWIDPTLAESMIRVNRLDMSQLYGDVDGDEVSFYLANSKRGHYQLTAEQQRASIAQFEASIAERVAQYKGVSYPTDVQLGSDATLLSDMQKWEASAPRESANIISHKRYDEQFSKGITADLTSPYSEFFRNIAKDESVDPIARRNAAWTSNTIRMMEEEVLKQAKGGSSMSTSEIQDLFSSKTMRAKMTGSMPIVGREVRIAGETFRLPIPGEKPDGIGSFEGPEYLREYFAAKRFEGGASGAKAQSYDILAGIMENMGSDSYDLVSKEMGMAQAVKRSTAKSANRLVQDYMAGNYGESSNVFSQAMESMKEVQMPGGELAHPWREAIHVSGEMKPMEAINALSVLNQGAHMVGARLKSVASKTPEAMAAAGSIDDDKISQLRDGLLAMGPKHARVMDNSHAETMSTNMRGKASSKTSLNPQGQVDQATSQIAPGMRYDIFDDSRTMGAQSPDERDFLDSFDIT